MQEWLVLVCRAHRAQRTTSTSLLPPCEFREGINSGHQVYGMGFFYQINQPGRGNGNSQLEASWLKCRTTSKVLSPYPEGCYLFFTIVTELLGCAWWRTPNNPSTWEGDHEFEISQKGKETAKTESLIIWEKGHTEPTPRDQHGIWQTFIEHKCARPYKGHQKYQVNAIWSLPTEFTV